MKTLTKDNVSVYLFEDNKSVALGSDSTIVGDPEEFIISDCNSSNSVMNTNVTAPEDWAGGKYDFDGTTWSLNSDYVEPTENNIPDLD